MRHYQRQNNKLNFLHSEAVQEILISLFLSFMPQGGLVSMLSSAIKSGTHVREKIGKYIADSHHPVER